MKVLVTGGAGYIGSTTCCALEQAGHTPVVLDNLSSGPRAFVRDRIFYEGDVADDSVLQRISSDHPDVGCVIHMAAKIVVPESVAEPYLYYRENVAKSLEFFHRIARLGMTRVVFSSSASVYAMPLHGFEVTEGSPLDPLSPYARTKMQMEQVLQDLCVPGPLRAVILRYFNPIGSEPGLRSGVHVREPTHVLGQLTLAATGQIPAFTLTGTDYPTRDGTGIRDYVHVWDLALAHVRAAERFDGVLGGASSVILNLGTGQGTTVRELVESFERATGRTVPVRVAPRRPGDSAGAFANVDRARRLLGWSSILPLEDGITSALAWMERRSAVLGYP